jgi:hypothetical protein
LFLSVALYFVSTFVQFQSLILSLTFHSALVLVFCGIVFIAEKPLLFPRSSR